LIIVHLLVFCRARRSRTSWNSRSSSALPGTLKFSIDHAIPHTTRTKVSVLLDSPAAMAIPGRDGAIATVDLREKKISVE